MIVAPKQGAVAQRQGKVIHHPALQCNDGLQNDLGADTGEALYAPKYRGRDSPMPYKTSRGRGRSPPRSVSATLWVDPTRPRIACMGLAHWFLRRY